MAKAKTTLSKSRNIVLRKKKISSGWSLYLDIHDDGRREKEYLRLYLTGDRDADKETEALAEEIKSNRIIAMRAEDHGIRDKNKGKKLFVDYFEMLAKDKDNGNWESVLILLKKFVGKNRVSIKDITPKWLDEFKKFLKETKAKDRDKLLSPNTQATYYEKLTHYALEVHRFVLWGVRMKFLLKDNIIIVEVRRFPVMLKILLDHLISNIACAPDSVADSPEVLTPVALV